MRPLLQLTDLILRDFVSSWYDAYIGTDKEVKLHIAQALRVVENQVWGIHRQVHGQVIYPSPSQLLQRLSNIDREAMTQDLLEVLLLHVTRYHAARAHLGEAYLRPYKCASTPPTPPTQAAPILTCPCPRTRS